jgi:hypothetical protein
VIICNLGVEVRAYLGPRPANVGNYVAAATTVSAVSRLRRIDGSLRHGFFSSGVVFIGSPRGAVRHPGKR